MNVNVRMMNEDELKQVLNADKEYGLLHSKSKNKRNRTGNVIELKRK